MKRRIKAVGHFKDVLMKPIHMSQKMSWDTLRICPRNFFDETGPSCPTFKTKNENFLNFACLMKHNFCI